MHIYYLLIWIRVSQTIQQRRYTDSYNHLMMITLIQTSSIIYNKNEYQHINTNFLCLVIVVLRPY
jgi:hypothetical protein